MGLRRPRTSIDVDDHLTITILDNGDLVIDSMGHRTSNELIMAAVEESIDSLTAHVQRLHLVRDMILLGKRVGAEEGGNMSEEREAVKPFYNFVETGPCADCDSVEPLVASQWGKHKTGDLICSRCESLREHEYGIPPVE